MRRARDSGATTAVVRAFATRCPSTHLWEDEMGNVHEIAREAWRPFDVSVVQCLTTHSSGCSPRKVVGWRAPSCPCGRHPRVVQPTEGRGSPQLWCHAQPRQESSLESWVLSRRVDTLSRAARASDPHAVVWKGDVGLLYQERGARVLAASMGSPEFAVAQLHAKSEEQRLLFQRIPAVWCNRNSPRSPLNNMTTTCGIVSSLSCGSLQEDWGWSVQCVHGMQPVGEVALVD